MSQKDEILDAALTPGAKVGGWEFVEMDLRGPTPFIGLVRGNERVTIQPGRLGGWFVALHEGNASKGTRYALAEWPYDTFAAALSHVEKGLF